MPLISTPRFVALDSWRGICACLVAMFHVNLYSNFTNVSLVNGAFLFVDFFFVLSGFVIVSTYAERINNGFGILNFMILRFGRVYPLHLLMLLLFIGVYVFVLYVPVLGGASAFGWENEKPQAIITNLLLIHSLGLHDSMTWNFPSWSISTEFYTYLFFAIAVAMFGKKFNFLMIPIIIVSPIFITNGSRLNIDTTYDYGFIRCLYGFGVGALLWWAYEHYLHKQENWVHENRYVWTAIEILAVAIAVIFVAYSGRGTISVLAPVVFSVVIYSFLYEGGLVSRILLSRAFVILGTLSYSIYMIHAFIIYLEIHVFAAIQQYIGIVMFRNIRGVTYLGKDEFYSGVVFVGTVLLVILLAFLSYKAVEAPGRNFFRRIVRVRTA